MSVAWGAAMISAVGQVLLIVLYTSVMLCALIGNSVVCWTVVSSRRMHCVINYFLVNLAVSDIMMAVLCIPFNFVANVLLHNWPFGAVLCPLVSYSQVVSVLLSAFTLLAISLDRYRAILFPMRPRLSTRAAAVVIGSIWTLALVVSLPVAVLSRLRSTNQSNAVRCDEAWPKETHRYIYSIVVMVMQYFLPLSVLVFTYTRIAIYIWAARAPGEALDHRDQRMAASKRKMVKMMLAVVVIYAICWLPLHVITLIGDAIPRVVWRVEHIQSIWVVCHWVAMSSCAYNPIVYCWMNSSFRRGFATAFRCMCFRLNARGPEARRRSWTWRTVRSTISSHRLVPIHRGTIRRDSGSLGNFKRDHVMGGGRPVNQCVLTNRQLLTLEMTVAAAASMRTTFARDQRDDKSGIDRDSQSSPPSVDREPGALESLAEASRSVAIAQLTLGQTSADQ